MRILKRFLNAAQSDLLAKTLSYGIEKCLPTPIQIVRQIVSCAILLWVEKLHCLLCMPQVFRLMSIVYTANQARLQM